MTKQERNEVILKALQTELQQKDYAVDVLSNMFELWVQGLISQGNDLLVNQAMPQQQEEQQRFDEEYHRISAEIAATRAAIFNSDPEFFGIK